MGFWIDLSPISKKKYDLGADVKVFCNFNLNRLFIMEDVTGEKIYILGSKLNDVESIIVSDKKKTTVVSFSTLELAKDSFKKTYDLLLAPKFTPTFPPGKEEMKYHTEFMKLMSFCPVFVELETKNVADILKSWIAPGKDFFRAEEKFFPDDYWHVPMRTGFLERFGVLDIAKDIETTPFVGANGKMVFRINKRSFGPIGNLDDQQLSQKEIDEILRQRGYM